LKRKRIFLRDDNKKERKEKKRKGEYLIESGVHSECMTRSADGMGWVPNVETKASKQASGH
jgi:hypothetical protein